MTEKIMINNHILLIIFHLTHHRTKIEGVLGNPITAVVRYSGFCFVWLANNKVIITFVFTVHSDSNFLPSCSLSAHSPSLQFFARFPAVWRL